MIPIASGPLETALADVLDALAARSPTAAATLRARYRNVSAPVAEIIEAALWELVPLAPSGYYLDWNCDGTVLIAAFAPLAA